jgi:hypothetical protein
VHPRLESILTPILRDLAATCAVRLEIVDERWVPAVQQESSFTVRDASGRETRVAIVGTQELWQDIADTAERMQEVAVEALWFEAQSVAWPDCPDHSNTHPLEAAVVSSRAVWRCPLTRQVIAEIGSLSTPE